MKEFIMCKKDFDSIIEWCYDTIQSTKSQEDKDKYLDEIVVIQSRETDNDKWTALLGSEIFKATYGEVHQILYNKVFVED